MAYESRPRLFSHKLTGKEVAQLVQDKNSGMTNAELALKYNVHYNTVANILRRIREHTKEEDNGND